MQLLLLLQELLLGALLQLGRLLHVVLILLLPACSTRKEYQGKCTPAQSKANPLQK